MGRRRRTSGMCFFVVMAERKGGFWLRGTAWSWGWECRVGGGREGGGVERGGMGEEGVEGDGVGSVLACLLVGV